MLSALHGRMRARLKVGIAVSSATCADRDEKVVRPSHPRVRCAGLAATETPPRARGAAGLSSIMRIGLWGAQCHAVSASLTKRKVPAGRA